MKKIFSKIHLWLSVPFGLLITLICFSGAMLRITSGRLGDWLGDIAMDTYLDQITDFIIAGLHGQAARLLAQPRLQGN